MTTTQVVSEKLAEKARLYDERVIHLQKQLVFTFIDLGEAFCRIRDERLFKNIGPGFKDFNQYLKSTSVKISRAKVYGLINIYENLVMKHRISRDRLVSIGFSKLYVVGASFSSTDPEPLLQLCDDSPKSRIIKFLREQKGKHEPKHEQGEPINLKTLMYAPINEMGVVFLFSALCEELGFKVHHIQSGFPDCVASRRREKGDMWDVLNIEFEFRSKDYDHPDRCDLIVCWEHNWNDCPYKVMVLKNEVDRLRREGRL